MKIYTIWLMAGCAVLAVGGAYMSGAGRHGGWSARDYARGRVPVIRHQLLQHHNNVVILAGDSHMELFQAPARLCGLPVVNAGVSGADAGLYSHVWDELGVASARAMVLTIGANNLLRKALATPERFQHDMRQLLAKASRSVSVLVVTAIPPAHDTLVRYFQQEHVESYSAMLRSACAELPNCTYIDPFAPVRRKHAFGRTIDGATRDGLHIDAYEKLFTDDILCRAMKLLDRPDEHATVIVHKPHVPKSG